MRFYALLHLIYIQSTQKNSLCESESNQEPPLTFCLRATSRVSLAGLEVAYTMWQCDCHSYDSLFLQRSRIRSTSTPTTDPVIMWCEVIWFHCTIFFSWLVHGKGRDRKSHFKDDRLFLHRYRSRSPRTTQRPLIMTLTVRTLNIWNRRNHHDCNTEKNPSLICFLRSQRVDARDQKQQWGSHSRKTTKWREIQKVSAVSRPLRPPRLMWTFNELSFTRNMPINLSCRCFTFAVLWGVKGHQKQFARSFLFEVCLSELNSITEDCSNRSFKWKLCYKGTYLC